MWWAGCAAATAGGLAAVVFASAPLARAAGAALILLPHAVGAPGAGGGDSPAGALPAELAASFVGASLAASFVFWLTLGGVGAWVFMRPGRARNGR